MAVLSGGHAVSLERFTAMNPRPCPAVTKPAPKAIRWRMVYDALREAIAAGDL